MMSTYYLNYGQRSIDGVGDASSLMTFPLKLAAVTLIVWSLKPFQFKFNLPLLLIVVLFLLFAGSLLMAGALAGGINDTLIANTFIQLPVLYAFTDTACKVDFGKWFRFIGSYLALQIILDIILSSRGIFLWTSESSVGGLGNPSSYGLFCTILYAFYLLYPQEGRGKFVMAVFMATGAIMSKSLFAVLILALVSVLWVVQSYGRILCAMLVTPALAALALRLNSSAGAFVEHKLRALGAVLGLGEYDVESSASVSLRLQIHKKTFLGIVNDPLTLLTGHISGKPYWPMDSQFLTYIGSFGMIAFLIFLMLNFDSLNKAFRGRAIDGGFSATVLLIFLLIFATNRILDYFPVAILYFSCIALAYHVARINRNQRGI